jgi:myo-inositol-1(or 4)-monophosphatase
MSIPSSSELACVGIQAALNAGTLLRSGFGGRFAITSKPGVQNLVTEYDAASEESIISAIFNAFPDHAILAEESGEIAKPNSAVTWIIDPLDGTVNFAHNIPVFSVSIAAATQKTIVMGVVFQPMTGELFVAEKGKGAFLNGRQIFVSRVPRLEMSILSTGFPYNVDKDPLECVEKFARMQLKGVPIRRLGSAAIDMSYVAAGRFDAFWEVGLHPWDMAAGKLLVEEAGGRVTHWDGSSHQVYGYETMLATNGLLHSAMLEHLK